MSYPIPLSALHLNSSGQLVFGAPISSGVVTAVSGTSNQITSSGGATPTLSLPSTVNFPGNVNITGSNSLTIGGSAFFALNGFGSMSGGSLNMQSGSGIQVNSGAEILFAQGTLWLEDTGGAGAKYVKLQAPTTVGTTYTLTYPANQGGANTFLQNDGSGNFSWASGGGSGTVNSGTGGQITWYSSSGTTVSGNANLTWNAGTLKINDASEPTLTLSIGASNKASLYWDGTNLNLDWISGDLMIGAGSVLVDESGNMAMKQAEVTTVKIDGSTSGACSIVAAAITSSYSLVLPAAQGGSSSFLQNNGSGTLSWATPGATSTSSSGVVGSTANTITTTSLTTTGGPLLIAYNFTANMTLSGGAASVSSYILIDGVEVTGAAMPAMVQGSTGGVRIPIAATVIHAVSAGAHTVTLGYIVAGGTYVSTSSYSLTAVELKT